MAIYHLKVTTGSKLKGASGTIRCDYITRQGVYSDREEELVLAESGNLPSWARDERHFWEAADTYERRNGRVYNEVEVALPRELPREQQIELAREFVSDLMTPSRLPYTMAIHDSDGHNPHAHVIYSERGDDGVAREMEQHFRRADRAKPWKGGAPKDTSMRGSEWVKQVRKDWEIAANVALERAGESARVDCRSYRERGIASTPQLHLGVAAAAMLRRGVQVDRVASYVRIERIRQIEREIEEELRRARSSVREEVDKARVEADEGGEEPRSLAKAPGSSPDDQDGASDDQRQALSVMRFALASARGDGTWGELATSLRQASVAIVPEGTRGDFGRIRGLYFEHEGVRARVRDVDRGASYEQLTRALGPLTRAELGDVCDVVVVAEFGDVPVMIAKREHASRHSLADEAPVLPPTIEREFKGAGEKFQEQLARFHTGGKRRSVGVDPEVEARLPRMIERRVRTADEKFRDDLRAARTSHSRKGSHTGAAGHQTATPEGLRRRRDVADALGGDVAVGHASSGGREVKLPGFKEFTPVAAHDKFIREVKERLGENAHAQVRGESSNVKPARRGVARAAIGEIDRVVSARERTADEELIARVGGRDLLAGRWQTSTSDGGKQDEPSKGADHARARKKVDEEVEKPSASSTRREPDQRRHTLEPGPDGPTRPVSKERIEAIIKDGEAGSVAYSQQQHQPPDREEGKDESGRSYEDSAPARGDLGEAAVQRGEARFDGEEPARRDGGSPGAPGLPRAGRDHQAQSDSDLQRQNGQEAPGRPRHDLLASSQRRASGEKPGRDEREPSSKLHGGEERLRGREEKFAGGDSEHGERSAGARLVGGGALGEATPRHGADKPGLGGGGSVPGAADDADPGALTPRGGGQRGDVGGGGDDPRLDSRSSEHGAPRDQHEGDGGRQDEERQREAERLEARKEWETKKAKLDAEFWAAIDKGAQIRQEMKASSKALAARQERHDLTLSWREQGYKVRELAPGEGFKGTYQGQAKVGEKQLDVVTSGKSVFFIEGAQKSEKAYVIEKEEVVLKVRGPTSPLKQGDEITFGQREGRAPVVQRAPDQGDRWKLQRQLDRDRGPDFGR